MKKTILIFFVLLFSIGVYGQALPSGAPPAPDFAEPEPYVEMPATTDSNMILGEIGELANVVNDLEQRLRTVEMRLGTMQDAQNRMERNLVTEESSEYTFPVMVLIMLSIGMITWLLVLTLRHKRVETKVQTAPTQHISKEEKLRKYVAAAKQKGISDDKLKDMLLTHGWKKELVEKVLK